MKKSLVFIFSLLVTMLASVANATSAAGQQYITMIVSGGPASLRQASEGIYSTNIREREVLDVVAEAILRDYRKSDRSAEDAVAWACRALGQSGDARYRNVLEAVVHDSSSKKLRKYADQALDNLPKDSKDAYQPGSVNLDEMRDHPGKAQAVESSHKATKAGKADKAESAREESRDTTASGHGSFADIREGMSSDEVANLIGMPTSQTSHITGKAFRPFYFGGDTARVIYLYKGKGRIVFSRTSMHTTVFRVVEIQPNPDESGYP